MSAPPDAFSNDSYPKGKMGNSPREEYIRALYDLSKGDPARWATFIEAFKVFTLFEYERSLSTPSGEAHIALGMNRRMRDLRDDFIHIENLADKLRK